MPSTKYKCVNFAGCDKALEREPIEIEDGEEPICPACGTKLEPLKPPPPPPPGPWVFVIIAIVLFGLGTFYLWSKKTQRVPTALTPLPVQPSLNPSPSPGHVPIPEQVPPESCTGRQLASAIKDRLAQHEELKAYTIQVDVADKTVILSGNVGSDMARNYAEELVRRTGCPITSIVNDLKPVTSDQSIAAQIRKAYSKNPDLKLQPIQVEVSYGHIVLSGSVCDALQRTVAGEEAGHTSGATTVTNNLQVNPPCKAPPPAAPEPTRPNNALNLAGDWTGTYQTCGGGQTDLNVRITGNAPDDITASFEMPMPTGLPGSFVAHGVMNTITSFLSLQFSGWQNQPPGVTMGNMGGLVSYQNGEPTSFAGIIRSPGCGHITLRKR